MTTDIPRYCPQRSLPPYSYVSGMTPHPISDARGHSFGSEHAPVQPLDQSSFATNAAYLYAIDLFNFGFYWEAHEEWEQLWHAAGRSGPTADFLKSLIKLAAAGVKLREGRAAGVAQHARRAAELIASAAVPNPTQKMFGLFPQQICDAAIKIAEDAERLVGSGRADASRSLGFVLKVAGMGESVIIRDV